MRRDGTGAGDRELVWAAAGSQQRAHPGQVITAGRYVPPRLLLAPTGTTIDFRLHEIISYRPPNPEHTNHVLSYLGPLSFRGPWNCSTYPPPTLQTPHNPTTIIQAAVPKRRPL